MTRISSSNKPVLIYTILVRPGSTNLDYRESVLLTAHGLWNEEYMSDTPDSIDRVLGAVYVSSFDSRSGGVFSCLLSRLVSFGCGSSLSVGHLSGGNKLGREDRLHAR